MRYLGIDFGKKRVGLALSDSEGNMAFPHEVIANDANLLSAIGRVLDSEGVQEIVIGHSKNAAGADNAIQTAIEAFVTDLTLQFGLPVHFEPEQYTTQEAVRFQGKTEKTDAAAASIILNSFLIKEK